MTRIFGFASMLGRSRYPTKTSSMPRGSEGFNLDNLSAQVFCSQGICLIVTFSILFHISLTRLWYLDSRESLSLYSPRLVELKAVNL